jgi:predicted extracellular nuclease
VRALFPLLAGLVALSGASTGACSDESLTPTPVFVGDAGGGADGAPGADDGGSRRPGLIRVATFNVRRFFDDVCDSGNCAAGAFEELPSTAAFQAQTEALAKGIALIDPDVIALEEVENARCLDALVAKLATLGKVYPLVHLGETGSPGSVDVGVLSRGALTEIKTHRDLPLVEADGTKTSFTREFLEVRMTFGAKAVVMFAAHFRSQAADDPARRLAEAKAAQGIVAGVAAELPDALVLLGGDLNDKPGSPPINAMDLGGALVRVASDLPVPLQGTYIFRGVDDAIDHIYVAKAQASRYVPMSATVYRDDPRAGFAGSDHASLAADFSIE